MDAKEVVTIMSLVVAGCGFTGLLALTGHSFYRMIKA